MLFVTKREFPLGPPHGYFIQADIASGVKVEQASIATVMGILLTAVFSLALQTGSGGEPNDPLGPLPVGWGKHHT